MPSRIVVAKELAEIFKVIAHPDRIRLLEDLYQSEQDVNTLSERLELPSTRVSQHLALLKAHRFVAERRDGRRHIYSLVQPFVAQWIVDALTFVEGRQTGPVEANLEEARKLWTAHLS